MTAGNKFSLLTYRIWNPALPESSAKEYRSSDPLTQLEKQALITYMNRLGEQHMREPDNFRFDGKFMHRKCSIMTSGEHAFDFWIPDEYVHSHSDKGFTHFSFQVFCGTDIRYEYPEALLEFLNNLLAEYERNQLPDDPVFMPSGNQVCCFINDSGYEPYRELTDKWRPTMLHLLGRKS